MQNATSSRSLGLGWTLLVVVPLVLAAVLAIISSRQSDPHMQTKVLTIAGLAGNVAWIALAVHWILVKKLTGLGILMLIAASTVMGCGLHTLLRLL